MPQGQEITISYQIKLVGTILTALITLAGFARAEKHCIPTNDHGTIEFDKPSLKSEGVPEEAEFTDDAPQAWEVDFFFDDAIPSTPSRDGGSATVQVHNHGTGAGGLQAVDGDGKETDLDPDVGDSCSVIEVCWTIRYPKEVKTRGWSFGVWGLFGLFGLDFEVGAGVTSTVWAEKDLCSDSKEVCPC